MDKPFQDFFDQQLGACGFVLLDNALIRRQRPIFFSNILAPKISQSKRFYREAAALLEQHAKPVLLTLHGGRVIPAMCLCSTEVDMMVWQLTGETVLSVAEVSLQDLLAAIDNPETMPQPEPTQRQNDYWLRREQELKTEGFRELAQESETCTRTLTRYITHGKPIYPPIVERIRAAFEKRGVRFTFGKNPGIQFASDAAGGLRQPPGRYHHV